MYVMRSCHSITETLKMLQIRPQFVTVGYEQKNNNLYVLVHKPTSKEVLRVVFRASDFTHDQKHVQKELYKAACWYHGGSIPSRPHWWHSKSRAEQALFLWLLGFTLFVILHVAKHLGWYK